MKTKCSAELKRKLFAKCNRKEEEATDFDRSFKRRAGKFGSYFIPYEVRQLQRRYLIKHEAQRLCAELNGSYFCYAGTLTALRAQKARDKYYIGKTRE